MRHARTGKKLGRDSAHRKALYANLACSLIEHGRIKTTLAKAKAARPVAEKMVTLGKSGTLHDRRRRAEPVRLALEQLALLHDADVGGRVARLAVVDPGDEQVLPYDRVEQGDGDARPVGELGQGQELLGALDVGPELR